MGALAGKRSSVASLLWVMVVGAGGILGWCTAEVYEVGGSAGWTTTGKVDYQKWAASQNFKVGDIIQFVYGKAYDNVLRVTHEKFQKCDTTAPFTVYSTGNDSVTIKSPGHLYFICGFPGHCQAGQKVDIRVLGDGTNPPAAAPNAPGPNPQSPPSPALPFPTTPPTPEPPAPPSDNSAVNGAAFLVAVSSSKLRLFIMVAALFASIFVTA
ncbi:early nodulin-like protein 15 [Malania oleifera]|uniref:early nodulin-like protein 15 n=1 Tax=Malania oleifera TaxID=397392 RepID=UPI0025ADEEFF|nr:early nodulin-like protein 15 [Malania oleifera]